MKLKLPNALRLHTGSPRIVSFSIPVEREAEYRELLSKSPNLLDVELSPPRKARSTGYRSQNSHSHGHYEDIAEQLSNDKIEYSPEQIGRALKLMAMKDGHWPPEHDAEGNPIVNPITKTLEPQSEAVASSAEAASLIEFVHAWADLNGLWLTEYIEGVPKRVYGGAREEA